MNKIDPPLVKNPRSSRFTPLVAALLSSSLLLTGCVSNKYKAASALGAQPQLMSINLGGEPVRSRLDAVIIYQGPGSWKKSAYWDELLVTFTNDTAEPVTLTASSLVDYAGTIVSAGVDPWQLEKASRSQRDRYNQAGINFALNTLGYAAFTYGAAGAGMMVGAAMTSTWGGLAAGATVGLAAVPVTAIVVYAKNQKHKRQIEAEFSRRRIAMPIALAPGESRNGSLFFPMTVSPSSLRLEWAKGGDRGSSTLPLPMLAGMHRQESAASSER